MHKYILEVNLKLDNRYFENVIKEMQPFFDENGFKACGDVYNSESKSVNVKYDDNRQMFTLSTADIAEGEIGEYSEINAWLFDDSQNAKDAASVGIDFVVSLRKEMGIKHKRVVSDAIDLPTATKNGTMNITAFTKKMLDVFPALKDEYKNHIALYGNFLYMNFFGEHLVPRLIRLFEEGTKKQIKKYYDVVEDAYTKGDRDTVNIVVALLTAAAYNNEKVTAAINEMLGENKHFLNSFQMFIPFFAKNKKLKSALIK